MAPLVAHGRALPTLASLANSHLASAGLMSCNGVQAIVSSSVADVLGIVLSAHAASLTFCL